MWVRGPLAGAEPPTRQPGRPDGPRPRQGRTGPIEIGGHPFPIQGYKPTREEGIESYRGVDARDEVNLRLYERATAVSGAQGDYAVETTRGRHRARHVVIATGFFDIPNRLGVPGEALQKVTHYYREPYPYVQLWQAPGRRGSACAAWPRARQCAADVPSRAGARV